MLQPFTRVVVIIGLVAPFAGCATPTADLELNAARQALDAARAQRAADCAKETFQAAETAIAEAARLADTGEVEAAQQKANEAKALADQASAASPPGCDQPKVAETPTAPPPPPAANTDANAMRSLEDVVKAGTVYFDYNESTIRADSKTFLTEVAQVMMSQNARRLEIEGHCDVRGSTEYNLHLGERRARSVMKYLVTQGVTPDQLTVISYGEERPVDLGRSEIAHQKNRRAELRPQ